MKGDPRWITAKFPGTCGKTGVPFNKGDRVWYSPHARQCYVGEVAEQMERDFNAAVQDEEFYNA